MARRLVIMGSGETTAGMLPVHRRVLADLPPGAACRLLDSPFAFQENADELVERIGAYFDESLGQQVRAVHLPAAADALTMERALAEIRAADWLFAGPGSPSYARRAWAGTEVPSAMAALVAPGRSGALVFASAAAVTLGSWALPVYEIYKVGEDPRWEPGLDLMQAVLGWRCAVVPHWDNREGGTHDTRHCWIGGRRLAQLEPALGDGFILGIDEHTAFVVDLEAGLVSVVGRGGAVLRVAGAEEVLVAGTECTLDHVEAMVRDLGAARAVHNSDAAASSPAGDGTSQDAPEALARSVLAALPPEATDARADLVALLGLVEVSAEAGARQLAEQLVAALVEMRGERRTARDWAASDAIRDRLAAVGVEVQDSPAGSTWEWR
jgi:cyanophycinase-like exopeptidase